PRRRGIGQSVRVGQPWLASNRKRSTSASVLVATLLFATACTGAHSTVSSTSVSVPPRGVWSKPLGLDSRRGLPVHPSFRPLAVRRPDELGPITATYSAGSVTAFVYASCRFAPFSMVEQPTPF